MNRSFQRGRRRRGRHGRKATAPKNRVPRGNTGASSTPEFRNREAGVKDDTSPSLGEALFALRGEKGWSRGDLERKTGIKAGRIAAYERGQKVPRPDTLQRLAEAFEVTVEETFALADFLAPLGGLMSTGPSRNDAAGALRTGALLFRAERTILSTFEPPVPRAFRPHPPCADERQLAPALWQRLETYPPEQRIAIVRENEDFHRWYLADLLCDRCLDAAVDEAGRAVELADLACLIADLVGGDKAWCSRLRGYTRIHLGNAVRVQGTLPRAEAEFPPGKALWAAGAGGDPDELLEEARVLDLEASLRRDQRQLSESLELLKRALAADRTGARTGRILINRAKTLEELDRYEEAMADLREAEKRIDAEREPRLFWNLRFNLTEYLVQLQRFEEAAPLLDWVREQAPRFAKGLSGIRLRWLEGRVANGLGRTQDAIEAFEQVRSELAAKGIPYDMALACLDLTVQYLKVGRWDKVRELARQMVAIFRAQRVERETLAAVQVFQEAADHDRATAEMARRLADYLKRAQYQPELRFEG